MGDNTIIDKIKKMGDKMSDEKLNKMIAVLRDAQRNVRENLYILKEQENQINNQLALLSELNQGESDVNGNVE